VLGRGLPGSGLQHVAVLGVHKAVNASITDDFDIACAGLEPEAVTGETLSVAIVVVDLLAPGEEALEGVIKVRCHD